MKEMASYVYGIVRSERRPSLQGVPRGLPGTGAVRLIEGGRDLWLIVADAPLPKYGSEAIERGLRDLDWVSQRAVAHEAVLRHFARQVTTVPMRLLTLFRSDDRAKDHVQASSKPLSRVLSRIEGCEEWGVRVTATPASRPPEVRALSGTDAGRRFLERKRSLRQVAHRTAASAPRTAAKVLRQLARLARGHRRLPIVTGGGESRLLLDAAFLVPQGKGRAFRAAVARAAAAGTKQGVRVSLSGPWPPYNFVGTA